MFQLRSECCVTAVLVQSLKTAHKFCFKSRNINFCRIRKRMRLMQKCVNLSSALYENTVKSRECGQLRSSPIYPIFPLTKHAKPTEKVKDTYDFEV